MPNDVNVFASTPIIMEPDANAAQPFSVNVGRMWLMFVEVRRSRYDVLSGLNLYLKVGVRVSAMITKVQAM